MGTRSAPFFAHMAPTYACVFNGWVGAPTFFSQLEPLMTRALRALCAPFACAMRAKKSPQFQPTVGESPHKFLFCPLNAQVYTHTQHVCIEHAMLHMSDDPAGQPSPDTLQLMSCYLFDGDGW